MHKQFLEARTFSENLSRGLTRSQGKLESRMEHVERTQEKLEDAIIQTKDLLSRMVSNINPLDAGSSFISRQIQKIGKTVNSAVEKPESNPKFQRDLENKINQKFEDSVEKLTENMNEVKNICRRDINPRMRKNIKAGDIASTG